MRAVVVQAEGSLLWQEVPDPRPGRGEVLLRVRATAINRADLLQRRGLYPSPAGTPEWMGLEAAGTIEELGPDVAGWTPGTPACCLLAGGGYAEKVVVHQDLLLPVPRGLSMAEAASLPEVFATAWVNLIQEGRLAAGETALIHAGASGVGIAAVQIARERGARIVTTVGSEVKARAVRELGAHEVIVYKTEDVTARLRAIEGGIDVVLDSMGGEDLALHLPLLNPGGRWVVIALMRGRTAMLDLRPLLSRRLRIIGSVLRSLSIAEKARILQELRREVWPKLESGAVRPVLHAVLPIEAAEQGHGMLERSENIGKVVLSVP